MRDKCNTILQNVKSCLLYEKQIQQQSFYKFDYNYYFSIYLRKREKK